MSYYEGLGIPYGLATTPSTPVPAPKTWWQQLTESFTAASSPTTGTGGAAVVPGVTPTKAPASAIEKIIDARNSNPVLRVIYNPAVVMGVSLAGAYHGYKRSGIGAAIGYSMLAGLAPPFTAVVMLAQGFAKPKSKS